MLCRSLFVPLPSFLLSETVVSVLVPVQVSVFDPRPGPPAVAGSAGCAATPTPGMATACWCRWRRWCGRRGGSRRRRTTTWSSARSWSRALLAARTRERSKMHGTSVSQRKRGAQLGQKQEARGLHRCRAFDAHNVICAVVSWHSARPPTARCCRGSGDARPRPRARQRAAGHWSGWRRGPTACCTRRRGPTGTRRRRRLPSRRPCPARPIPAPFQKVP